MIHGKKLQNFYKLIVFFWVYCYNCYDFKLYLPIFFIVRRVT